MTGEKEICCGPGIFLHEIRVPYAHVDQMTFVYYANYFVYFEMARSELLREAGEPYPDLERKGILLPIVEAHCDYKRPAHYDELLVVKSKCSIRGTRLRIEYEVRRDADLIVTGHTEHVCMTRSGKVLRPVPEIRKITSYRGLSRQGKKHSDGESVAGG